MCRQEKYWSRPIGKAFSLTAYNLSQKLKTIKSSLISITDKILLKKRVLIKTVYDELKNIAQIEHSRHYAFSSLFYNF